ncbi:WXG100-like domain-containing protein [Micromonospora musae]|uniref:Outer membrane channel protein CpnT-like N-terminal domain-containing protein n=1 Tax=Micromonospora musae TaxID=1894970 RepID=A0A3A9Y6E1_9ACTN|nr:hypothetical protein [Micromonospora musae]RKN32908.1 hypothetical protein D7044_11790 [Micromonospora musae]
MSDSDHALAEILEWFSDLEAAIPGVRSTVGEILIGKIPESDIGAVYDLADTWADATEALGTFYEEAAHAADGILNNWSGDGASAAFAEQWYKYIESLAGSVDTLASMEQAVQSYGLQVELMKFMALIGLIMLAVSLFMLVAAAIPSLGLSTAGIPGAFAACRAAIGAAASNAMRAIGSISVRAALAEATALVTRALPTLVRTQLPNLVRTQLPRLVTTQLPNLIRHELPTLMRHTLPTLLRQGGTTFARGVLPRNVIARSVADRMAGQWLRSATNRELLRQLGREAGLESRRLAGRGLLAARNQLAKEIEEQLLRKFGARVGTDLAGRAAGTSLTRMAGNEVFEQVSREALGQYAAREIAATTFSRELAKYVGTRVAFGAGFMGAGDLLGQMYQIAGGERASLDLGQLGMSTLQGGVFGASMFGGITGHIVGGGVVGAGMSAATLAAQGKLDLTNITGANVTEILHGGAEGAKAGAIFGAQNKMEAVNVGSTLRIGHDVVVLPEGIGAFDRADGLQVTYSEHGASWQRVDGSGTRIDGGSIGADGTVLSRDSTQSPAPHVVDGDVIRSEPSAPHTPLAQLPSTDVPQRTNLVGGTGGGDGGGGGGGPRQPAHPTSGGRTGDVGIRTTDPSRPVGELTRPTTDHSAPVADRTPTDASPQRPTPDSAPPGDRTPTDGGPTGDRGPEGPSTRETAPDRIGDDPSRPEQREPGDAPPPEPTRSEPPGSPRDTTGPHPTDPAPTRPHSDPVRSGDAPPPRTDSEFPTEPRSGARADTAPPARPDTAPPVETGPAVRGDTPPPVRTDAPPPRVEGPTAPRADAPTPPRADGPTTPRADGPTTPRADGPTPPRADSPTPPRADSPTTPRTDSPTPPRADGPPSPRDHSAPTSRPETPTSRDGQRGPTDPVQDRPTGTGDRNGAPTGRDEHGPPPSRHEDPSAPVRADEQHADPTAGEAQSGASIRPRDELRAQEWANKAYDRFRADPEDVPEIAAHLAEVERPDGTIGYSQAEIARVKQHLMFDEHTLRDYPDGWERRRFDADEDIAEAWIRLREGRHLEPDLVLLEHELAESGYMRVHPDATYPDAHAHAQSLFNWERVAPGRTGEDLDNAYPRRTGDGDSGGLRTDPTGQSGGRIQLRLPGEGSSTGHPEGLPPGDTAGRGGGHAVPEGVRQDPADAGRGGDLAGRGELRGVTPEGERVPFELVPVEPRPVGPSVPMPEAVRSTFDGHIGELLTGRDPGPVDQPHRASWDESSRLLTVEYPDGVTVQVALQVNSSLPPGQPVVLRPGLEVEHGQWVQREPAGVVLPDHLPNDPNTRAAFVDRQLGDAWSTLHRELHQVLDRPVEPPSPRGDGTTRTDTSRIESGPRTDRTPTDGGPRTDRTPTDTSRTDTARNDGTTRTERPRDDAAGPRTDRDDTAGPRTSRDDAAGPRSERDDASGPRADRDGTPTEPRRGPDADDPAPVRPEHDARADGVPESPRDTAAAPRPEEPPRRADEPSLAELERPLHPDPPVLDRVTLRDATPSDPAPPRPLTPDTVRGLLADAGTPEQVRGWARDHLAVRQEDGSYVPRSQAEIDAAVTRLHEETAAVVDSHVPADPNATPEGAVHPEQTARPGDSPILQELAPSENFPPHRTRTGAELPEQVHELVQRAKENLLGRYPETAVAARIADLDAIGGIADRLQTAADAARESGRLGDVVQGVRDLSRAVNEYADQYRDWRDFERGGDYADPGWRDLDGVDPLNSVEMATRVVSVDPQTHRFHVMDQAIAIAKIGDVLGPTFEGHAARTFERLVPKDMESVDALLPPELRSPELDKWIQGTARGGFNPRTEILYVDPRDAGGSSRPISAVAATVVHESMHRLQPRTDLVADHIDQGVAEGRYGEDVFLNVMAPLRFEGEFQAFAVQQQFLRGLAGFREIQHGGDLRVPRSDGYQEMADWTPQQMRDSILDRYVPNPAERAAIPDHLLDQLVALTPESVLDRARLSIDEANFPIADDRRQGTFYGPMTRETADRYGIDLDAIGQEHGRQSLPRLLDQEAAPETSVPRNGSDSLPLAEWGPRRDGDAAWPPEQQSPYTAPPWRTDGPAHDSTPPWHDPSPTHGPGAHHDGQPARPEPERRPGALSRALRRITGLFGGGEAAPHAPEPNPATPQPWAPRPGEPSHGGLGEWGGQRPGEPTQGGFGTWGQRSGEPVHGDTSPWGQRPGEAQQWGQRPAESQQWGQRPAEPQQWGQRPGEAAPSWRPGEAYPPAHDPYASRGWPPEADPGHTGTPGRPGVDPYTGQARPTSDAPAWGTPERAPEPRTPAWSTPEAADRPAWTNGPERASADPVAADGRTNLALTERSIALEELRASTDPVHQAQVRADLQRIDADLAQRGYPVHQLERVPEAEGPTAADAPAADGRDHSRHDEIWSDPPWRQEDRRPSLDELIPSSQEEATAWGDSVRREFADQLDGREFAGLRIRVDLEDPYSVSVHRNEVVVRAEVQDANGVSAGRVVRSFQRDHNGSLFVEHVSLKLDDRVQGHGFAREFNDSLIDWYRYSGVERIEVHAASTVGGYAWARDGYDWAPNTEHRSSAVLDRLRVELRGLDADVDMARRLAADDPSVDADRLRKRYGTTDPEQVAQEVQRQREAAEQILERARTSSFGSARYPTPFDISQAGWGDHHHGREASWVGKRALLGADWKGVKEISDTGPLHPRSAHTQGMPRVPDPSSIHSLLSGDGHPPVTAARVPEGEFHGYGRDVPEPDAVRQLGDDALRQVTEALPEGSPLKGVRLELTTVPADALPDGAVARSVPIDAQGRDLPHGTVPPEGGGWRVELSDRASDVNVARAVAHEAAELTAIRQRADGGLDPFTPDALVPGAMADGATLSPHDHGRLAEAEVLADLLRDPAQAAHARTELRALRDHLGLHPDDPGAAARSRLLDGRISDAGRDALLGRERPPADSTRSPADGGPARATDGETVPPAGRDSDGAAPDRVDADPVPDRSDPAELTAPERSDSAEPTVPERPDSAELAVPERAETAAATYPARTTRVPFDFERFLNDPRWADEATQFEQRLGAYYFRDPEVLDTVRTALTRMRDILVDLTEPRAGETPAQVKARVESAFFRDDAKDSAGQVGSGVGFDRLIREGNLRETMTAFYNAAYTNQANPHTLSHALRAVLDGDRWEQARAAGVDVPSVRRMGELLDGNLNRLMPEALQKTFKFGRDFFATGNVARNSEHGVRDLTEMTASQKPRQNRSHSEMLERANTPDHYASLGTPLGRLERAYVDQLERNKTGEPLGEHGKLPWREGVTAHHTDRGPWAWWVGRDGFPVIDGVSGTTARMLTAARFIGLDGPQLERFLSGLMGWMLPARDHSLFEILRGSEIAGVARVDVRPPGTRFTAVDLYRALPDIDLPTLRREVGVDGLLPHEARYLEHAVDPRGFSETQHKVPQIADRLWPQLESGHVRDPDLADWLRRNGIDPTDSAAVRELGQRLSKPHVMALTVYTRHSHYLINNVIRGHLWTRLAGDVPMEVLFGRKIRELVTNYLDNLTADTKALPLPLKLRSVVHVGEGHLNSRSDLAEPAQRYVDAHRRIADANVRMAEERRLGNLREEGQARLEKLRAQRDAAVAWRQIRRELDAVTPQLLDEMRWHADMVHDAMMQLPALGSPERPTVAYRGDWITPVYSPIYGSSTFPVGIAREFLSVSRQLDVAVRFMSENPASGGKVLVVYLLTGEQARDISVFSSFAEDDEAVFPPRSRMRRTSDHPELVEQVRAGLPEEFRDNCEIIVMKEERP